MQKCASKQKETLLESCEIYATYLDSLGRLLYSPICVEGLKLLLDSSKRVGKLSVVQHDDGLLNPRQQV